MEKIVHSVYFHFYLASHAHVNYNSNILICITKTVLSKNHRCNFFPVLTIYLNLQECQKNNILETMPTSKYENSSI